VKLKQKPNGIYYLDVRLPDAESGELKRTRVSLDTRDPADAEAQRRDWLAGRHPKHPAMGGVIAPKGAEPRSDMVTGMIGRPEEIESPLDETSTMHDYLSCGRDDASVGAPALH
jgi:hypothetical protein